MVSRVSRSYIDEEAEEDDEMYDDLVTIKLFY